MFNRTLLTLAILTLTAGAAHAQKSVHLSGLLGFDAESEVDEIKFDKRTFGEDVKEDLEDNFGVQLTIDGPIGRNLRMGVRLAGLAAEGEDDAAYRSGDAGVWFRYLFGSGAVTPFIGFGGGLTYVTVEGDVEVAEDGASTVELELDGLGWHIAAGVGLEIPGDGVSFSLGLYMTRQTVDLEGDLQGTDIEVDGAVMTRTLFAAGLAF